MPEASQNGMARFRILALFKVQNNLRSDDGGIDMSLITIRGTVIETGVLNSGGRGVVIQADGELVTLDGLTNEECKSLDGCLEHVVEITIRPAG